MATRTRVLAVGLGVVLLTGGLVHAATDPAGVCKEAKAKAAGSKAAVLLAAFANNIRRSSTIRLAASVSKAQSRMTAGFSKAEGKGGCETTGDVGAIEAKVDAFALSAIEDIGGATCGNGVKGGSEECDGGGGDGSGPSADCEFGVCGPTCECAGGCGDGVLGFPEACDEGPANGSAASCCNADCTLKAASAPCGDSADTACTNPDTCDGAGSCQANDEASGFACGNPASSECTGADTCNGAGTCLANHAGNGAPCGDQGVPCHNDDACDGAGSCIDNGLSAPGTSCGSPASTECTDPDTCNGAGACLPNHAGPGAPCGDQGQPCRENDTCDGAGGCTDNGAVAASTPCPDTDGNMCTSAGCDGGGTCDQGHVVAPDGATCGPGGGCSAETCQGGVCTDQSSCCSGNQGLFSVETRLASGSCGILRNVRCSNATNSACAVDADCNFGSCIVGPNICTGNFSVMCPGGDGDCQGSCTELSLPFDLECGGAYTGGGSNSVPLPWTIPDKATAVFEVTDCDGATGALTLGPTTPEEVGIRHCTQGRRCSDDDLPCVVDADCYSNSCENRCLLGPPQPVPNSGIPPSSFCAVNVVVEDGSGSVQCVDGATDLSLPMATLAYLTGDLFQMTTPPNIPGVQPCPLCDRLCVGGSAHEFPCDDDSSCPGGFCDSQTRCLGGPNDGITCQPETSPAAILGNDFPTSHDCPPEPSTRATPPDAKGPFAFDLTSGSIEKNGPDLGMGTGASRVFCGFCRDNFGEGSLCFEGNTSGGCPAAIPPANGSPVPCDSNADCADGDEYESCAQRSDGAFSESAATQTNLFGSAAGQCLGDEASHDATLVSAFCIGPSFDPQVDAAADLPGPGVVSLPVTLRLSASGAFVDVAAGLVD